MNEFNRCQTQLKDLYSKKIHSTCMTEFTCYQILYCLFSQQHIDTNNFLKVLSPSQLQDEQIRVVLKILQLGRTKDFQKVIGVDMLLGKEAIENLIAGEFGHTC